MHNLRAQRNVPCTAAPTSCGRSGAQAHTLKKKILNRHLCAYTDLFYGSGEAADRGPRGGAGFSNIKNMSTTMERGGGKPRAAPEAEAAPKKKICAEGGAGAGAQGRFRPQAGAAPPAGPIGPRPCLHLR